MCNTLNHSPGYDGVANTRTVSFPTWEYIIWNLQQEGFDGNTLDDDGITIPLVDTSMDWDTVIDIIHKGFKVNQDWGVWDDSNDGVRFTSQIQQGSTVWYTLSFNPEDQDCTAPSCSGYHQTGCYETPSGKHNTLGECLADGCDNSDWSNVRVGVSPSGGIDWMWAYGFNSSQVVTYTSPFTSNTTSSPLPWRTTSQQSLSNENPNDYDPREIIVQLAQLITRTSLVGLSLIHI